MNQIMEQIASEKIAVQAEQIDQLRGLIVGLVWKAGQGKPVTVSAGSMREAAKEVESIDFRRLRSGEIRFTIVRVEKEGKG